ncbi:SIR2 family protein [Paracoccus sp. AK26]|uniref:SIR2 family protein n=1 Tax=Paracoccus sp. AK26 TaxID=2589076 RepID=UPI001F0B2A38|nr:SIR2 family protein [Paracoccus sp. AK26]
MAVRTACEESQAGSFDATVKSLVGTVPGEDPEGGPKAGNIERLLSLCKMRLELLSVMKETLKNAPGAAPQLGPEEVATAAEMERLSDFVELAEETILGKVGFVNATTELSAHADLLAKFGRRSPEKPRVRIFTTNYDLCVEEAALRLNAVLIDGFSHSARQRYNRDNFDHDIVRRRVGTARADFVDGVFQLYKLHGSVDWRRSGDEVFRSLEMDRSRGEPVLIYPRSTKYQEAFDAPYLDMFAALQAALREPDTMLIISGFGFADDHISSPIWSALQSNLSLNLILCDVCFVPEDLLEAGQHEIPNDMTKRNLHQKRILQLALHSDRRVTVLNGRFDDLVAAIPQLEGMTDRQRLEALLAKVNEAATE